MENDLTPTGLKKLVKEAISPYPKKVFKKRYYFCIYRFNTSNDNPGKSLITHDSSSFFKTKKFSKF
jgi:hypothetical protein